MLCGPAEQGADKAGQQAKHAQLQGIEQQRVMARKAQTAEQRTGIEAACGEAGSRQRDGNARQQNRSQARKVQIAFSTAQCAPYLPVAVAGSFDALMGLQPGLQCLLVSCQCGAFAAPELPVAHSAARLDDTGRGKIVQVHQHAWRQAVEITDPIGLVGQHAGQAQQLVADFDVVTDCQVQGGEQPGLGPGFTRGRTGTGFFGAVGLRRTAQGAAQGIAAAGRFDTGELQVLVGGDDAGKFDHLGVFQPLCLAGVDLLRRGGCAAAQHQVGAKELAGPQQHGVVQACTEIADGGTGGDGDQQGEKQHAQLAGASVAQQLPVSQSEQARLG